MIPDPSGASERPLRVALTADGPADDHPLVIHSDLIPVARRS